MRLLNKTITAIIIFLLLINCQTKKINSLGEYVRISEESKQHNNNEVNAILIKARELRSKKNDFIAYKSYSIGSIRLNKIDSNTCPNCNPDDPLFLFWNENGKAWIQKSDNCGIFFPIELNNFEITDFVNDNFKTIKSEKIKYYSTDKNTFSMIDHSTFKQFLIVKSDIEIYNHFDLYNMSNNPKNINYNYNNNLKIVKLDNMIKKEIKKLDSLSLFKRDLSRCNSLQQ
ncbi:MAG: hypothetical protein P0Y62_10500 [Candidatus Chryseobacterium colombiense]|nr:hypothetical protein [Chryseobacterium sp.]WEK68297.1 MAG: hypothetical protein P0Y62_10500 [Chryseobacterium sp.]